MSRSRRAMSLAAAVVLLAVITLLAMLLAETAVFQMQVGTALQAHQQALNLAESAASTALARVLEDDRFGRTRAAGAMVHLQDNGDGYATFNQQEASALGVPYSTNNLHRDVNQTGWGRLVPPSHLHVVGCGMSGGVREMVEILVARPPYGKALLSSGSILSRGQMSVRGSEGAPGSLASHANVTLGPQCYVSGDVTAVGHVDVEPSAVVEGSVTSGASPEPMPHTDIRALIDGVRGLSGTQRLSGPQGPLLVDWYSGCAGDLIVHGDLTLQDGVLWVDGNLTVDGAVRGEGLVLCGGGVNVTRGSDLQAQNRIALAAGGPVHLSGQSRTAYAFQGLVYSQGPLQAKEITVVGSGIADGGAIELENVDVVQAGSVSSYHQGKPVQAVFWDDFRAGRASQPTVENTFVSLSWRLDPSGQPLYTVHVLSPKYSVNRTWTDLREGTTPSGPTPPGRQATTVRQLAYDLYSKNPQVQGNQAANSTLLDSLDKLKTDPDSSEVVMFSLNNLLVPGDRARVVLWRQL